MFIVTARFSRRKALLFGIAGTVIILSLIFFHSIRPNRDQPMKLQLSTNADRVAYLQTWGWKIQSEPVKTFRLQLPETLDASYTTYNKLQQKQGFDLSAYCGKQVIRYTYTVTNYPDRPDGVQINLILCDGIPISGDVVASGRDGFQTGLTYPGRTENSSTS